MVLFLIKQDNTNNHRIHMIHSSNHSIHNQQKWILDLIPPAYIASKSGT